MLTSAIEHIFHAGAFHGYWGYPAIFIVTYLERSALVSVVVPGGIIVLLAGVLASRGYLDIVACMIFACLGAIAGDVTSYLLGRMIGRPYFERHSRFFFLKKKHVNEANEYFREEGGKSIFFSRFISILSTVVPFSAGMSRLPYRTFLVYGIIGNLAWTLFYGLLGYFFGWSWKTTEKWPERFGLISLALLVVSLITYLLRKKGVMHRRS